MHVLRNVRKRIDPARYNGASLLGLRGIVIKSHGNAEHKAFGMAIRVAMLEVEKNVPEKIIFSYPSIANVIIFVKLQLCLMR